MTKTHEPSSHETIIVSIPHSQLRVSDLNPRKVKRDDAELKELAENILANGVLQNLTARPKGKHYEIVFGEGRFLAVELLIKEKRVPKDYLMPVCVKKLADLEMLELATSENMQRADMHPVDEANAFREMVRLGSDVESIALKMGVSRRTVEQRLTLAEKLSENVKAALLDGTVTLAQAQQLTNASTETQDDILEQILSDDYDEWTPDDIKAFLSQSLMPVRYALFDKNLYKGEYTNNLFDDEHETCFVDSDQAKRLQLTAMEARRDDYAKVWAWVEVKAYPDYQRWYYQEAESVNPSEHGVLILYHLDTMKVDIKEGIVKRTTVSYTSSQAVPNPPKDRKVAPYTKALLKTCHHLKTRALQSELSTNHRTCLILNIMGLLGCYDVKIKTELPHWSGEVRSETVAKGLEPFIRALEFHLGKESVNAYPLKLKGYAAQETKLYDYLKTLEDDRLQDLFNLLTALTFGTWYDYEPLPKDRPLPVAVARDLDIDMQKYFTLSEDFLEGYRKSGLLGVLRELGYQQDFSMVTTKGLREFVLSSLKDKTYLPKLVQFSNAVVLDLANDEADDEELDAA